MDGSNNRLRVLTWNIHGGRGLDFRHNIQRIGNILQELNTDIVALQEVDLRRESGLVPDILDYLKEKIGDHSCHAWTIIERSGNYGHVLISRHPIEKQQIYNISIDHREPRAIIETIISMLEINFCVIAVHLGIGISDKMRQLKRLQTIIHNNKELPIILLGDFNEWWGHDVDKMLTGKFQINRNLKSFPSFLPVLSLDKIFFSGNIKIINIKSIGSAWRASDHLPIMADIEITS